MEPITEIGNTNQGGEDILDQIEAEAAAMSPPPGAENPQPGEAAQPDVKVPFQQPAGAFDATHEMIIAGIKTVLKKYPGGNQAGEVWDSPLFKQALIPVMQKYNISIFNMPVELVLLGAIFILAKETVSILRAASATDVTENKTA